MRAVNPATIRKPLRDHEPVKHAYLDPKITRGHRQYDLLVSTCRTTLFGSHIPPSWTYTSDTDGNQRVSQGMNDLIETAIDATSHLLRRPQVTARELVFIELFEGKIPDDVMELTLPPLSDDDLITQARRITAKLVRTNVLKIRRPYKRHDDGTLVLDAKGEPKRDYIATMRIAEWTQKKDDDGVLQSWTSPLAGYASGIRGETLGAGIATGTLARQATSTMVNKFMVDMLNELLADLLDADDLAWLMEYYDSLGCGTVKTPAERQRACSLMRVLQENKDALEQFAYLVN